MWFSCHLRILFIVVLQEVDCTGIGLCCVVVVSMNLFAIDPSTADEFEEKTVCASGSGPPAFALF